MQKKLNLFNKKNVLFQPKAIIIDGNSVVYRAYYGIPDLSTAKGEPVNAIYGFFSFFLRSLALFQPQLVIIAFDSPGPTFRHQEYIDYKAKRTKTPSDLIKQIIQLKIFLESINILALEKQGFEADDIIGTVNDKIYCQDEYPNLEVVILSGDLDLLQLINKQTKVCILTNGAKKFVSYGEREVIERYDGIKPNQLIDMKGLKGDASDNIPGVPGIGEKTAIKLIKQFQTLDNLYQELDQETEAAKKIKPAVKKRLLQFRNQAFFSQKLSQIEKNVFLDFKPSDCQWKIEDNNKKIIKILEKLEFHSLIKRFF